MMSAFSCATPGAVIDRRVTIMGSYNFSAGAALDSEDLNVVTSEEVADGYARHWRTRRVGSRANFAFTKPSSSRTERYNCLGFDDRQLALLSLQSR
jgi:hypothetical protein